MDLIDGDRVLSGRSPFGGSVMRTVVLATALALALGSVGHAEMIGPSPAGTPRATMDFVRQAAQSDAFERQAGQLASQRSRNPAVRDFARRMVRDHTMTTNGLKMAMRQAGMRPPPPPPLSGDQRRMLDQLRSTPGPRFDRIYMDQQVTAHQNALQLMHGFAQAGQPQPLREAAKKTAPMVQQHLDMAERLQARLGG
jgi:putative membrane protein